MGEEALKSHAKGKKHQARMQNKIKSVDLASFCKPAQRPGDDGKSAVNNLVDSLALGKKSLSPSLEPGPPQENNASSKSGADSSPATSVSTSRRRDMNDFKIADEVTKAEILWSLNTIMSNMSLRGSANSVSIFPLMFGDSNIVKKVQLQKSKLSYLVTYGIAPYAQKELVYDVNQASHIVLGFDESFNKISQKEQMDINVRYWSTNSDQVESRYVTSTFLGHTRAVDLLDNFLEGTKDLKLNRLGQVSMDGPTVNHKFLKDLKAHLVHSPDSPILLEMGTCGLHTVHNAFKCGILDTKWEIIQFLRSLYDFFKCVPARRADYTEITKSELFPLKFCAIRWIENTIVAERAREMLPDLKHFLKEKKYESSSYQKLVSAVKDPLLPAKLAFFYSLASDVEPFLTEFQCDKPMGPFLFESLTTLLYDLMSKIIKPEILEKSKAEGTLCSLDVNDKINTVSSSKIDLGFATKNALKKCKSVSDREMLLFRKEAGYAIIIMVSKLQAKCPLAYRLTKGISALSPTVVLQSSSVRASRMKLALGVLVDNNWISGAEGDRALREYNTVCESDDTQAAMKSFDRKTDRLDTLWMKVLKAHQPQREHLKEVVKLILILSHGNASLERGFSINKNLLIENLSTESLVAQRQVHDFVTYSKGIEHIDITKSMIQYTRNSHSLYKEALEKKRQLKADAEKSALERKRAATEIKALESKKQKLLEETRKKVSEIESQVDQLKS